MALLNQTQQQYYSDSNYGNYQFTSLKHIINQFMVAYVGEDKIISKVKRTDVQFHAMRALQELSFDTFKSCKSQEITVPASLTMILPQDYVNYTKISWSDSSGIKHRLYPTLCNTSNPTKPQVDSDDDFLFDSSGNLIPSGNLLKNGNFHGGTSEWILNIQETSTSITPTPVTTLTGVATLGDPEIGWFYGYDGNAIRAYDVQRFAGIHQLNVPIVKNEQYTVTYTISGYTSGTFNLVLIDENGDYSSTTNITTNGTYTETITASDTASGYTPNQVFIRNKSTTELGNIVIDNISVVRTGDEETSTTWGNYKSGTPSENQNQYDDDTYWPMDGSRFGLDPQHAQANGSFYIDNISGKIHFSSNISGKTVILDYISDSLGTDDEMQVHKFAEEAMYKWIVYAILSTRMGIPEYIINRYKKERFAETRKAKIRLSNIKLEEITQILRGKSKQIKH